jgi:hypothetical protein
MLLLVLGCSDYELNEAEDVVAGEATCVDVPTPAPYAVSADSTCVAEPAIGSFDPVVEWRWEGHADHPGFINAVATPVIGNLHDDDGDGVLGEGDQPDIVFVAFFEKEQTKAGILVAMPGDGQGTHWTAAPDVYGNAGLALGDLDGDGFPEICASSMTHSVVCLNRYGQELWRAGEEPAYNGHPAIADLDADGTAEVVYGREVFRADGTLMWRGTGGLGGRGVNTHAAIPVDLDGDGQMEVVAGNTVYDTDGTILWQDGEDGYPAIGNFDDDGDPEWVRVSDGWLILSDTDGSTIWSVLVDVEERGGPPTVADFDGDGQPEVGVAGYANYTVLETDGTVLWTAPTEDDSSSVTGSSVFDFEGDGAAEVVYADEETLWVYDGATGAVLLEMNEHASNTRLEYPVIADVDGDGATEIVLVSANAWWAGWAGVTVIGDVADSWAPARRIWNQHAYSITNVGNFGSIPVEQQPNWLTWNNFRAAGTELGPAHWQPDLLPGEPEVCTLTCIDDVVSIWVPIENRGLVSALDVWVDVAGQPIEVGDVGSGEVVWVGPVEVEQDAWEGGSIEVDPLDALQECREENERPLGDWPCD